MGFKITLMHDQSQQPTHQKQDNSDSQSKTVSQQNAYYYQYYEDLISEMLAQDITAGDKLALALILTRGCKPTLTKNRDLSLIDIDKMISVKNKSLKQEDIRMQNMKMAADLSGIKNNLFIQRPQEAVSVQDQSNRPQIFRLIRAAQIHYLTAARQQTHDHQTQNGRINTDLIISDND